MHIHPEPNDTFAIRLTGAELACIAEELGDMKTRPKRCQKLKQLFAEIEKTREIMNLPAE